MLSRRAFLWLSLVAIAAPDALGREAAPTLMVAQVYRRVIPLADYWDGTQLWTRGGGERLMLHRGASPYPGEHNADLLKFRSYDDAEARVVSVMSGQGRHSTRMGALVVETIDGRRFRLGGGFSDAQRDTPPPIGTWVTYRFNGTNASGLPRFARFVRVHEDR